MPFILPPNRWITSLLLTATALAACDDSHGFDPPDAGAAGDVENAVGADIAVTGITSPVVAIVAPDSATVDEGKTVEIAFALSRAPLELVLLSVESTNPDVLKTRRTLFVFGPDNWNQPQRVSLTAEFDGDGTEDEVPVVLRADGLADRTVGVRVRDTEAVHLVLSADALTLAEGAMGTVHVSLRERPSQVITVDVSSSDPAVAGADSTRLHFWPSSYSLPQPLTINTIADADALPGLASVDLSVGRDRRASIAVNVTDAGRSIIASSPSITVVEGRRAELTISLSAPPATRVEVSITSADPDAARPSLGLLSFDRTNYNRPRRIEIAGVSDLDVANETVAFHLDAAGYARTTVAVTVDDDEEQELRVSPSRIGVFEGDTGEVLVSLSRPPGRAAVVTATLVDGSLAHVEPPTLTFTDDNYFDAQAFRIIGRFDANTVTDRTNLHVVTDGVATVVREVVVREAP